MGLASSGSQAVDGAVCVTHGYTVYPLVKSSCPAPIDPLTQSVLLVPIFGGNVIYRLWATD